MIHLLLILAVIAEIETGKRIILDSPFHQILIYHSGSALALILWCLPLLKRDLKQQYVDLYSAFNVRLFALIVWIFFPLLGPACVIIFFPLYRMLGKPEPHAVMDLIESIEMEERFFNELTIEILAGRFERMRVENLTTQEGEPLIDLLKSGNLDEKKRAVRILKSLKNKEAIRLLKAAQSDPDYDIQYLATITLLDIEREQLEVIRQLVSDVELDPLNLDLRDQLVTSYVDLCQSDLLSRELIKPHMKTAEESARVSVNLDPKRARSWLQLGKLLIFSGRTDEAKSVFEKAVELDPNEVSYRFWLAEAQFNMDEIESVKDECSSISRLKLNLEKIKPQVEFWSAIK